MIVLAMVVLVGIGLYPDRSFPIVTGAASFALAAALLRDLVALVVT